MGDGSDMVKFAPSFDRATYAALIDHLVFLGYRFCLSADVGRSSLGRTLWMRHDVELSVMAARATAEMEAARGVRATYLLCLSSPMLAGQDVARLVARLVELGHEVGLHLMARPTADSRERLDGLRRQQASALGISPACPVSLHAPSVRDLGGLARMCPTPRVYTSVADAGWRYLSDATGRWRWGSPFEILPAGNRSVQLLTHPYWWCGEDMYRPRVLTERLLPQYLSAAAPRPRPDE